MDLQEEYFLRHKIAVPIVRYPLKNYCILERQASGINKRYQLISIDFVNKEGAAGVFDLRWWEPMHNGFRSGRANLNAITDVKRVIWDEFDEYCRNTARSYSEGGWRGIVDPERILIATWDMFMFTYDSMIAEMMTISSKYLEMLPKTRRAETVELQYEGIQAVVADFERTPLTPHSKMLLAGWRGMQNYGAEKTYGRWLGKLINSYCTTTEIVSLELA